MIGEDYDAIARAQQLGCDWLEEPAEGEEPAKDSMTRALDAYDSHPPAAQRIEWVRKLAAPALVISVSGMAAPLLLGCVRKLPR